MAKPRKTVEQHQANPAREGTGAAPSLEALGEQLLREARAGHAEFAAGWQEFMAELGIQGKPIDARALRDKLLREGINPDNNEFSRGIIAMREE
jgi:hypothetical protein